MQVLQRRARFVRSQAQLAHEVGVTRLTVHRALKGQPGVSRAKREEILKAAARLGYRPNTAARATVTGRTNCVSLLLSTEARRSTLFPGLVQGAHDALDRHDMHLTITRVPDEKLTDEGFMPKALRELMADGLLINYNQEIPATLAELVDRYQIPSVWVNSKQPADCVYPDDFGGAHQGATRLLEMGHRRIAFVCYTKPSHYSVQDRYDGYAAAMATAGLTPRFIGTPHRSQAPDALGDDARLFTDAWMSQPDRPTAVVTYHVREALAVLLSAAQHGLRVPQDLSIVTLAESVQDAANFPITCCWIERSRIGRMAVETLLEKIKDPTRHFEPVAVPLIWWQGDTCAPAGA